MTTHERPAGQAQGRGLSRSVWAIAGACWVVTVAATLAGGGHGHHGAGGLGATLGWHWQLAAFAAAWTVMVGAMMLPSAIPMLEMFWAASARQRRPGSVRAMVIPYFVVWLGFAGLALVADAAVQALVGAWGWLAARPDLVLGGVLVLAGGFQFTSLKKACLTGCRSPLGLMWEHYRQGVRAAWRLGVRHALLCLGCCWALMLVMFATGAGGLAWMLLLTALMVAEKTTAWGGRLVTPTGVAFIASGGLIAVTAATAGPAGEAAAGLHDHAGPHSSLVALLLVTLVLGVWAAYAYHGRDRRRSGAFHIDAEAPGT